MSIRAIAFDLDDTLLHDDLTISARTVSVLQRASESGITVIPASGRARDSMKGFVEQIGCAACYVSCNGAEVWSHDHELLMRKILPRETTLEIARFAASHGVYAQTYEGPHFFYNMEGDYAAAYARSSMLTGKYVGDLETYLTGHDTAKILMMADADKIAAMLAEGREQFLGRVSVTCSKPYFLEFNPLGATKGEALAWCGKRFGFDLSELAAFGDSLNDMSMLTAAGMGVAVDNARPDVKAQLTYSCPSNNEDGVACFIQQHILNHQTADQQEEHA